MKKIIFSLTLLLFIGQAFGQMTSSPTPSKDYYLKKNTNQKTLGWIFFGGGLGMIITGSSIYKKSSNYTLGGPLPGGHYYNNSFSFILAITGLGAVVGSIPLFISAHNNKKRAASVAISNQNIFLPQQNALKTQPTVSLRIAL